MDAAKRIRDAVTAVGALRSRAALDIGLLRAVGDVKRFQAGRFAHTYVDLLQTPRFHGAARFFLDELYGDQNYSARDDQFARIAGALQTFFPQQVVATAVRLAELHALTEELDHQMGRSWQSQGIKGERTPSERYVHAWLEVGRAQERRAQLTNVLEMGKELDRLTRTPGLRLMLRMMRRPAHAAGLSSLQTFLESGFDTFAAMGGHGSGAAEFLQIINRREEALMDVLFNGDLVASVTAIAH